jgi:hypothetical protein
MKTYADSGQGPMVSSVSTKMNLVAVFWFMTPCSDVVGYESVGGLGRVCHAVSISVALFVLVIIVPASISQPLSLLTENGPLHTRTI